MADTPIVKRILSERVFAVLRLQRMEKLAEVVGAIREGGISIIEVTLNSKNALDAIHTIEKEFPDMLVGAGTVIGYEQAVQAVERGAKFLVSPVTDLDMLAVAKEVGVVSMAGALTPTEAWQASVAGADFVKIFPLVGLGPDYIRAIRGPLNKIRFVPTNGVSPENIVQFLEAGAAAAGLGSTLVSDSDIERGVFDEIRERAKTAVGAVKKFKQK